jgi:Domain of unknown function
LRNTLLRRYIRDKGPYFTPEWFKHISEPTAAVQEKEKQDAMDTTQVVGLGFLLIATVTFASAFTLPGGYNSDNGTPVLGRRYIFKAFILAHTMAFMKSFILHLRDRATFYFNITFHIFLSHSCTYFQI